MDWAGASTVAIALQAQARGGTGMVLAQKTKRAYVRIWPHAAGMLARKQERIPPCSLIFGKSWGR
jgi:hypothetical protein